ncbi:hypothetical protein [Paenibacillus assamensis]|uniref:hypothetical protein n=1 Tax=Paenibacillus assamensis TaxID=311244 RepID=UPI00048ACF9D|nr:hypothetical protein [Paenibacillus assamensis]
MALSSVSLVDAKPSVSSIQQPDTVVAQLNQKLTVTSASVSQNENKRLSREEFDKLYNGKANITIDECYRLYQLQDMANLDPKFKQDLREEAAKNGKAVHSKKYTWNTIEASSMKFSNGDNYVRIHFYEVDSKHSKKQNEYKYYPAKKMRQIKNHKKTYLLGMARISLTASLRMRIIL